MEGEIDIEAFRKSIYAGYENAQKANQLVIGTPRTVIPKLKHILDSPRR